MEAVLPLPGAILDVGTGVWSGPIEKLHVRALRDDEHADVLKNALAFAKKHGVENPEAGDPLYDLGKWLHTLAIACIDPESPIDNPQPYFDGGWEQVHKSELLTPEVIAYVAKQQEVHQFAVNPLARDMTNEEFLQAITAIAGGNMAFFVNMRPGLQWSCMRTLASLHLASLGSKSDSSQPSAPPPTETRS